MIEDVEAGSQEAVETVIQRAKALCQSAHDRINRSKRAKKNNETFHLRADPVISDISREIWALEEAVSSFENGPVEVERIPYKSETKKRNGAGDGDIDEFHESFGLLQISRVQSTGTRLFGSHLEGHSHYIVLNVHRAVISHGLSSDRQHPTNQLIQISMSGAQFAEAITSLNSGVGAPCTIERVLGTPMESVPTEAQPEHRKIRDGFENNIAEKTENLRKLHGEMEEIIATGKTISKSRAKEMLWVVNRAWKLLDDSAPFVIDQFRRSADRVVTSAKADVEAFASHVLQRTGMAALAKGMGPKLLLGETSTVDLKELVVDAEVE